MITTISKLLSFDEGASKGLGQLEAYANKMEGVSFQMDNELIWDSSGRTSDWAIRGVTEKNETSKFFINHLLSSGKVTMSDWNKKPLAPIPPEEHPEIYPLRSDPNESPKEESLLFDVFYIGNKVAFQAHNGLFLTRVYRDFHTIEAAKTAADDSCYFRPMIGDLHSPTFKIFDVITYGLSQIKYHDTVLQTVKFENRSDTPASHSFTLTWRTTVTDRVVWTSLWGRGVATTHEMEINGKTITLKYTEDNEKTVHVTRNIHEEVSKEVVVPPKSKCTARLIVDKKDSASFSFMSSIKKVKPGGSVFKLKQPGAWTGLLYDDIYVDVKIERNQCTIQ